MRAGPVAGRYGQMYRGAAACAARQATSRQPGSDILDATMKTRLALAVATLMLSGCIVVPRTVEGYDNECRIVTHQMTLDTVQIGRINNCNYQRDCAAIVAALAVTAASAIVSGTIAVVGNVVYWGERRVGCAMADTPAPMQIPAVDTTPSPLALPAEPSA